MGLFDLIAPVYGLFFEKQTKYYKEIQEKVKTYIDLEVYTSVLDIGCGTGALCKALYDMGLETTGVDPSKEMIKVASNKLKGLPIKLYAIEANKPLPFPDKSFDIVITSYVAHGLKKEERLKLYKEMKRLARDIVIVHDYNENRALLTTIIEWLENGDYFNFIKEAVGEIEGVFVNVEKIDLGDRAAWYICRCKD